MEATAPTDAGQGPTHVILEGTDDTATDQTPGAAQQTQEAKPQDPDDIVLELGKVRRSLQQREQALVARERKLGEQKPDPAAAEFTSLKGVAKTDPYAAGVKLAELVGLDVNDLAAALVKVGAGGEAGKLTPEQEVARLRARMDDEAKERQRQEDERKAAEQKRAEDAAYAGHISDLKGLVAQGNFPLIQGDSPEEAEANVREAFDLMVLAHNAGKKITHINALHMIEKELRETSERRAAKLGFQRTGNPPQRPDSPAQWAQQPNPRANQSARSAPIEAVPGIRSDEEIAADLEREFQRAGAR